MSKIPFGFYFFLLGIMVNLLCAEGNYEYEHRFVLKKDELGLVYINRKEATKKATAENPSNEYLLKVRWTLFANDQLFVLVNYRGHPYQYILKKNEPLKSVTLPLLPDGDDRSRTKVWLKIIFNDFQQETHQAVLDMVIEDNEQRIEVEFKPKKSELG